MPKFSPLAVAGVLAALCGAPATAEDLLQVYRQALESDPSLKAAVATREAAREIRPQARALSLPSVGVTLEQDRTFGLAGVPYGTAYNSHTYAIALQQPIYNRSHQVQRRLAEVTIGQAEIALLSAEDEIIPRVAQGYFGVLAALDNLNFAVAEKNAFARQLEQANRRFEVGLATITDVYDAQARFDGAVSQEIDAANTLADAREALRQFTGQDYASLQALGEQMPLTLPEPRDPERWVGMALDNNLRLRSARLGVEQARENIQLQKAGHYPTVSLNASRADVAQMNSDTSGSQIGVQVNIPLYSGGAVSSRAREAAYQYEAARQNLENLQREIMRVVRDAYRAQETAISQINALNQTRVSTRSALEATQAGYEVGTRTIVDVLTAERNVYQAGRDYAAARYKYVMNYLTLRQAAGPLAEGDLTRINAWLQGSVALPGGAPSGGGSAGAIPPTSPPPVQTTLPAAASPASPTLKWEAAPAPSPPEAPSMATNPPPPPDHPSTMAPSSPPEAAQAETAPWSAGYGSR